MTTPRRGRSIRRTTNLVAAVFVLVVIAAGVLIGAGIAQTRSATDRLVNQWGPAAIDSGPLLSALVNQETGIRGYAISADQTYLQPYTDGRSDQAAANRTLGALLPGDRAYQADLAAVTAAATRWQDSFAQPVIDATRSGDRARVQSLLSDPDGKAMFDQIRARFTTLRAATVTGRDQAVATLQSALTLLVIGAALAGVLVVVGAAVAWTGLRRRVIAPVARLAADSRVVAGGDYDHRVVGGGPAEIHDLGADVEAMRQRVVSELVHVSAARAEAERTTASLARSNADLEQFAYVASHDLQEPLRKVSNFCQLLERQYGGDLDDRARVYIGFAVDGAKRMQVLINDLLSFSRVGRNAENLTDTDLRTTLDEALASLSERLAETGGTVVVDPDLPTLPVDPTLLTVLWQNLVGNALKYHGEDPPTVHVSAQRRQAFPAVAGDVRHEWVLTVADNGIGIDPQYAQRIFVIFQRLHLRDSYGGTGIGLAMCKKIVEYHGGTIWLAESAGPGATFCFTLPEGITA